MEISVFGEVILVCCLGAVVGYAIVLAGVYVAGKNYKRQDEMVEERRLRHDDDTGTYDRQRT